MELEPKWEEEYDADSSEGEKKTTWEMVINNYTDKHIEMIKSWETEVSRMVVSKEVGAKGTPHLQGKITFKAAKRWSALRKMCKCYWRVSVFTRDSLYVMKEDSEIICNINNAKQGQRSDLEDMTAAVANGMSVKDLWKTFPGGMVKYHKGMYELIKQTRIRTTSAKFHGPFKWAMIDDWSKSHIFWGEAGIGKTEFALTHFSKPFLCSHIDELREFDPEIYDGVIFDDMSFTHTPRTNQIHLLDIDQDRAIHLRNITGFIPANTKKIFTCNVDDGGIVDLNDAAIRRRVEIHHLDDCNSSWNWN